MFFGKFDRSLDQVIRHHPEWREPLRRVIGAVREVPMGAVIDPILIAISTGMTRPETLAYLNVLREAGLGDFVVRIITDEGVEVKRFARVADIPACVEDEFGESLMVMPENIDLAFEPQAAIRAPEIDQTVMASR